MRYKCLVIEKILACVFFICVLFFEVTDIVKTFETYTFQWRIVYDLVCLWPSYLWIRNASDNLEIFYDY